MRPSLMLCFPTGITLALLFPSMHQDNCGYLCMIIQPALKEDAGWYTVSAKNEAGIVSSTARLDVYSESRHTRLDRYPCEDLPRHNPNLHTWLTLTSSNLNPSLPKNVLALQVQSRLHSPQGHTHTDTKHTLCSVFSSVAAA